ncbi:sporulation transcriptional regulator SpoIIID [Ruthenibacterium sp. TH_2024_36131]
MKGNPEERAIALGQYVAETGATVRNAAMRFGISKSTVHKDLTQRLKRQNRALYNSVQKVLQVNKEERHLRGGAATRQKYHPNT